MDAPSPEDVDWAQLTPRGCAILAWIAVPISLGLTHRQIAERLNLQRPEIENLPLPPLVYEDWIGMQLRRLRAELRGEDAEGRWE
jgi:hypothetical protein